MLFFLSNIVVVISDVINLEEFERVYPVSTWYYFYLISTRIYPNSTRLIIYPISTRRVYPEILMFQSDVPLVNLEETMPKHHFQHWFPLFVYPIISY